MALTQLQLVTAVADRAELSKNDAKRALSALEEIVLEELGNAQKVRIGGLVQLTVRQASDQEAQGQKPGDWRRDRDRGEASKRGRARPAARSREVGAALGAEGASAARCLTASLRRQGYPSRRSQGPPCLRYPSRDERLPPLRARSRGRWN